MQRNNLCHVLVPDSKAIKNAIEKWHQDPGKLVQSGILAPGSLAEVGGPRGVPATPRPPLQGPRGDSEKI